MINLENRHLQIIKNILSKYPYHFFAFGSRVKGTNKPFSDLDLCAMDDLPDLVKCYLSEAFEESTLPFKVDIIEWNKVSREFREIIKKDFTSL